DDRLPGAQEIGAAQVVAVVVARVAEVGESLREESPGAQAGLQGVDGPAVDLRGAVGAGEFDGAAGVGESVAVYPFGAVGDAPVDPGFAAEFLDVEVAHVRLPYARCRRVRRVREEGGLRRIVELPFLTLHVLTRDLVANR